MWLVNAIQESVIFRLLSILEGKSSVSERNVVYVHPDYYKTSRHIFKQYVLNNMEMEKILIP